MRPIFFISCFIGFLFTSCEQETVVLEMDMGNETLPKHFPAINYPTDNPFDAKKAALGRALFFDPILSRDSTVACATCHQPELYFTDGLKHSVGIERRIGPRNAPSLMNVAFAPYFLSEGGVPTLEMQVLVPIQEHAEMDDNILRVVDRINKVERYRKMSLEAFGKKPDAYVITRALANFERTLLSGMSAYDDHLQGVPNGMSVMAQNGLYLFHSARLGCSECHSGVLLTDFQFYNNGTNNGDPGRERLTENIQDRGKFKVPSLRNIAMTAPYMHDGSLSSIQEVVHYYENGGGTHPNKDRRLKPFQLSARERSELIAFLEALTDHRAKIFYAN